MSQQVLRILVWRLQPTGAALIVPAALIVVALVGLPLLNLLHQSVLQLQPGGVGAAANASLTIQNYAELLRWAYVRVLLDTLRLSGLSAVIAVGLGFLLAYRIARTRLRWVRKGLLSLLVALMFLSVLVRSYAIALTFGPTGLGGMLLAFLGLRMNSRPYTEMMVVLGFLHFLIPISALMLVGTIQNINPNYFQAATSLGAPTWRAHLTTTVPLAVSGIFSAFLVTFSLAVSSFLIPLILGRGKVEFLANLTYSRFSELADYPSGAAVATILLTVSLALMGLVGLYGRRRRGLST